MSEIFYVLEYQNDIFMNTLKMSDYIDVNKCVFCKGSLEGTNNVTLTGKGANRINEISDDFDRNVYAHKDMVVHVDCRKDHSRLPTNKQAGNLLGRVVRKSRNGFVFKDLCLFCATPTKGNDKKRGIDARVSRFTND